MKNKIDAIQRILIEFSEGEIWINKATSDILDLFGADSSLPTDECVEQWWAAGQDKNEGFWQDAPYRTNGDVVEEIKTALRYFIETRKR
jgi:hypothetical protein